jgi:carboxypeptidase Q
MRIRLVWACLLGLFVCPSARPPVLAAQTPATYQPTADRLIDAALRDSAAWQKLARLTDTFGHRLSGSESLERAIDWMLAAMRMEGLDNVRGEPAMVPRWVRGEESAELVAPRPLKLPMLGLGGSIGTPPEGITAEVLVVSSFADLEQQGGRARGRIILFDVPFTNYGATVQYRGGGASAAARVGAVAALVRSVGPFSLRTPHTGAMRYDSTVAKIPAAAITTEDAAMLHRMQERGEKLVVRLQMAARTEPDAPSRNVVAELRGSERPEEVVVMGGHIDSWDVGQGANDDAGGVVAAWEAIRLMKDLGLRPRRTIRVVGWTNEENGGRGGTAYRDQHADELDNHLLAIESDGGIFTPVGFGFTGSDSARAILRGVVRLLERVGADSLLASGGGADIGPIMQRGVPGMSHVTEGDYFWYHHTNADTVDKIDPRDLARSVAMMAVMAYVVADLPGRLPR